MSGGQRSADLFQSMRIVWQCRAGHYCLGLSPICPITMVLCVDDSTTHDLIEQQEGIRFLSLEKKTGRHDAGRDSALNEIVPCYREELEQALRAEAGGRLVLVATVPSRALDEFAAGAGCELISNRADLQSWLNDKTNLLAALPELGLPRLRGRWTRLNEMRYAELASETGASFVAQLARGTSGSGTAFIESESDYAAAGARFGDALVWIAPDVGDLSVNINAMAMEGGVAVSCPSVQLVGLPMLSAQRGMYCGNDYVATSDLPGDTVAGVVEQTERIGGWLASLGFRGLFGLDFVLDTGTSRAYAVDLNPRWQGSTAPLTLAEYREGRLPLAVAELGFRLGRLSEAEILRHKDEFLRPVAASHISLRCPAAGWAQVTGALSPGVYSLAGGPRFARAGLRLNDLQASDEILVTGGVPRRGTWMAPRSHIVRVTSQRQVMDIARLQPVPWARHAAAALYEALALAPVEES
jgi:hypothetical protein